jgi:hypothetical protein
MVKQNDDKNANNVSYKKYIMNFWSNLYRICVRVEGEEIFSVIK